MWNLARTVAEAGRVDDAVGASEAIATFHTAYREEHLANAALALARAGRGGEVRPRLEALQAEVPDDRLITTLCAGAYQAMGDEEAAEVAYEHAADVAVERGEPDEVEDSLTTLATFHEDAGRADDARSARDRLQAWRRGSGWISAIVHPVRSGPKIGRNQPCPCGSGRKHKHCCGR